MAAKSKPDNQIQITEAISQKLMCRSNCVMLSSIKFKFLLSDLQITVQKEEKTGQNLPTELLKKFSYTTYKKTHIFFYAEKSYFKIFNNVHFSFCILHFTEECVSLYFAIIQQTIIQIIPLFQDNKRQNS